VYALSAPHEPRIKSRPSITASHLFPTSSGPGQSKRHIKEGPGGVHLRDQLRALLRAASPAAYFLTSTARYPSKSMIIFCHLRYHVSAEYSKTIITRTANSAIDLKTVRTHRRPLTPSGERVSAT